VVEEDDELIDVLPDLSEGDVHRALVLEGDRLVGFLSITDVLRVPLNRATPPNSQSVMPSISMASRRA
jgi:CBS domain-containing protein